MKLANIPVYGNIAVNIFLITKIHVYILFNQCAKVTQCAFARLVAHWYQGPTNLLRMRKKVWVFNGRRSKQVYDRNTKQHIVNVYKMYICILELRDQVCISTRTLDTNED